MPVTDGPNVPQRGSKPSLSVSAVFGAFAHLGPSPAFLCRLGEPAPEPSITGPAPPPRHTSPSFVVDPRLWISGWAAH